MCLMVLCTWKAKAKLIQFLVGCIFQMMCISFIGNQIDLQELFFIFGI